ncbi:hypothetical protein B0H19DRAFT_1025607 [Mycena capillaripes]|nr:hypothetical protein B0H19DRAFT_1025607 [Mycena capillaripes]
MHMDTEYRRVQELWFEDGNLVIEAGKSQYRVYRGVLSTRSPVFQDMLAFPQPPHSELVDDFPIVRLPDSEGEVTPFLKALFDPLFFRSFPAPTEFDVIVGCLRLSHKYGVEYLRRRALVHLSSGYRTKLDEFDICTYYGDDLMPSFPATEIRSWPMWPDKFPYIIAAIQLAREVGIPWILPVAFYDLCVAYGSGFGRDIFHGVVRNGLPASLDAQDQQLFAKGHIVQNASTATDILRFLSHPVDIDGCPSSAHCLKERMLAISRSRMIVRKYSSMPLHIWGADEWELLKNLCPVCISSLTKAHQDSRQAFWDKLPEIYGLPPWEELERLKVGAIGNNVFY